VLTCKPDIISTITQLDIDNYTQLFTNSNILQFLSQPDDEALSHLRGLIVSRFFIANWFEKAAPLRAS
jgi:hypothetical protein